MDGLDYTVYGMDAVNSLRSSGLLHLKTKEVANRNGYRYIVENDKYSANGSIHKYFNNGVHNADDFPIDNCREALFRLSCEFNINPCTIQFLGMEYGVNIVLPFDVKEFLHSIVMYRGSNVTKYRGDNQKKDITTDRNGVIIIPFTDYVLKIYDKSSLYPEYAKPNTLRIEIKVNKTRWIRENVIADVRMLSDIANTATWQALGCKLLNIFDGVVVCNIDISELQKSGKISEEEAHLLSNGMSSKYWKKMPPMQRKRAFDAYAELLAKHSTAKKTVMQLLSSKIEDVTKSPFSTLEEYVTHTKNVTISPFIVTESPFLHNEDIEDCEKGNVTISHVDKVGFDNTSFFSSEPKNIDVIIEEKDFLQTGNAVKVEEEKREDEQTATLIKKILVLAYMEEWIEKRRPEFTKGSYQNHSSTLKYLKVYCRGIDIDIKKADMPFMNGFSEYMRTEGLRESTIKQYSNCLKGVLNSTRTPRWW
jgi:hypothetical protein